MSTFTTKRFKFFIVHLACSLIFACIALRLMFGFWYPNSLSVATGVTWLFLMMLAVDVIVGPVLGFIVYKEGKKTLKMDLTIIILIQLSALLYGLYSIEQGRPAWLVFHTDRFELVRKNDIILGNIEQAQPQFQQVSSVGPQFAAVKLAASAQQRQDEMFTEVLGGVSLAQQPERYVELTQATTQIQQRALSLKALEQYNSKAEVEKTLAKYPNADAWVPLKANAVDMVVLINKEKAEVIKIVDLRPWH